MVINNKSHKKIIVIGAGAFGGWTALRLLETGVQVMLVDTWGPGNSRASSGGDTRVLRSVYNNAIYTRFNVRALELWQDHIKRRKTDFFRKTGVIWMLTKNDDAAKGSLEVMRDLKVHYDRLTVKEAAKLYPQINFDGISSVIYEEHAGYLLARRSCEAVCDDFIRKGGNYLQTAVKPGVPEHGSMPHVIVFDGTVLKADCYIFACGPWLGSLFPEILGDKIIPTRQEVHYFGTLPGDNSYRDGSLPVWLDQGDSDLFGFYGIPGGERRGFKIASDLRGETFDPTFGERIPSREGIEAARDFIHMRFPGMKGAPLLEARVCQYENTPDHHFIIDRHPQADNVWFIGGGSGHGFKHGPAVGEYAARCIVQEEQSDPEFLLSRFNTG